MYRREHHNRIASLLGQLNAGLFKETGCFFGGGTAIVLLLDEYRESVDIDFIVSNRDGYSRLREVFHLQGLTELFVGTPPACDKVVTERDKILLWLETDSERPIKMEIVFENRIDIEGEESAWGVPVLSKVDMFAEKLLANTDRWGDSHSMNRDILDLAIMIDKWGPIPQQAWTKAEKAYRSAVYDAFGQAVMRISDQGYLQECISDMSIEADPRILLARLHGELVSLSCRIPSWSKIADFLHRRGEQVLKEVCDTLEIPASSELVAFIRQAAIQSPVQQVDHNAGIYHGVIVWTDNVHTIQSIENGVIVAHVSRDWHPKPAVGESVTVRYAHGLSQPE